MKNKKTLIAIGILLALIGIIAAVQLFAKRKTDKQGSESESATPDASSGSNTAANQATISEKQAAIVAGNLLAAMDKMGTNTEMILSNLNGLGREDLKLVIKKFGTKPYGIYGQSQGIFGIDWFSKDLDLIGWLKYDMAEEPDILHQVKQIFETNGITF